MPLLSEIRKQATTAKKPLFWRMLAVEYICLVMVFTLAACATASSPVEVVNTTTPVHTMPATKSADPTQTPQLTPSPSPTIAPTPTAAIESIEAFCSPLQGIELKDLHSITSQAFTAPSPFLDDGHPAVDLAFFTFDGLPSMLGHPVQAVLPGKVVMVVEDRFPFGHMILIETPLEMLPESVLAPVSIPTPIPAENIALFDPCTQNPLFKDMSPIQMDMQHLSVYSLYSHLKDKPTFAVGDVISCGQTIGAVGITGNSVAEHLHLEIRIGPSAARFNTFAMYKPDATVEERYNYCIWSSSGRFQAIDPARFWQD